MTEFETIAASHDASVVRVLVAALRAHGFHPLEGGEDGLPGMPGVTGADGIPVRVPAAEARDAKLLAEALLEEMRN